MWLAETLKRVPEQCHTFSLNHGQEFGHSNIAQYLLTKGGTVVVLSLASVASSETDALPDGSRKHGRKCRSEIATPSTHMR